MKIKYSKWGLANRIKDTVVLNENLKKYPKLHKILIDHELRHNDDMIFNVKHDLKSMFDAGINEWMSKAAFMIKHPGALLQLSPIWYYEGRTYLDLSLILMYLVVLMILCFFF